MFCVELLIVFHAHEDYGGLFFSCVFFLSFSFAFVSDQMSNCVNADEDDGRGEEF